MTQKLKLLLLVPHLGGGGAEQVTAQLARHIDPGRFEIHLALITPDHPGSQPPLEWVTVHRFHRVRVRQGWLQILKLVYRLRPRVVLSNMAHLNLLILLLKPFMPADTRILVRHNASDFGDRKQTFGYCLLYPKADAILCQSQAMAQELQRQCGISPAKLMVLHNPIDTDAIQHATRVSFQNSSWRQGAWPRLLSIGRLSREKGMDLLIAALALVRQSYPDVQLTILGSGAEEEAIRRISHELNIADALSLPGYILNPASYYREATLFVLPSRSEGMPNALLEAAAAGMPLVATPCCEGVRDLLSNAEGTWLTEKITSEALAKSILQALSTLPRSSEQPQRFQHDFLAPFQLSTAIAAYESLIESIIDSIAERKR